MDEAFDIHEIITEDPSEPGKFNSLFWNIQNTMRFVGTLSRRIIASKVCDLM